MSNIHLHLILNHIPVITTFLSFIVTSWGFFANNSDIKKVGLTGYIISGILIIPVFLSGSASENMVKMIPEISTVFLYEHQEAAYLTLLLTGILGLLGILGYIMELFKINFSKVFIPVLLIYSFVTIASMTYTAYLGGNIRHTELIDETMYETIPIPDNASVLNQESIDTSNTFKY